MTIPKGTPSPILTLVVDARPVDTATADSVPVLVTAEVLVDREEAGCDKVVGDGVCDSKVEVEDEGDVVDVVTGATPMVVMAFRSPANRVVLTLAVHEQPT
jgi:hypothetical protein